MSRILSSKNNNEFYRKIRDIMKVNIRISEKLHAHTYQGIRELTSRDVSGYQRCFYTSLGRPSEGGNSLWYHPQGLKVYECSTPSMNCSTPYLNAKTTGHLHQRPYSQCRMTLQCYHHEFCDNVCYRIRY
ncbi:hypothetical protein J6590_026878 [Homalodisca vitripennis]|nr:hypothetical protein J6590_026878 [Homalodisca vitripennis]